MTSAHATSSRLRRPPVRPVRAFTLLESVIVLGLVALLYLAISANFSGVQSQGATHQAQATAQSAVSAEYQYLTLRGAATFTSDPTQLSAVTPDVTFLTGSTPSTSDRAASVAVAAGTAACPQNCVGVAVAASTPTTTSPFTCWYLVKNAAPLTEMSVVYAYSTATTLNNCTGAEALTLATLPSTSTTGATQTTPYDANFG